MAFTVTTHGLLRSEGRIVASECLTESDFRQIAIELGQVPVVARKMGTVSARQCDAPERIVTYWNGVETSVIALPRQWIVTSLTRENVPMRDSGGRENTYVIEDVRFQALYVRDDCGQAADAIYRSVSLVEVIEVVGGFDILAPWGERQRAPSGYLVLNGELVYGNNRETFELTYLVLKPSR